MRKIKLHDLNFKAGNNKEIIALSERNKGKVLTDPVGLVEECKSKGIPMIDLLNCTINTEKETLNVYDLDVTFVGQEVEAPDTFVIECSNGISLDVHLTAVLPLLVNYLNKNGGLPVW